MAFLKSVISGLQLVLIPRLSGDDCAMIYDRTFKRYSVCIYGDTNDVGHTVSR